MSFRSDLREGHEYGVPLCCNLRWSITYALDHDADQAIDRGIAFTRDRHEEYVPCGLLHHAAISVDAYNELLANGVRLSPEPE